MQGWDGIYRGLIDIRNHTDTWICNMIRKQNIPIILSLIFLNVVLVCSSCAVVSIYIKVYFLPIEEINNCNYIESETILNIAIDVYMNKCMVCNFNIIQCICICHDQMYML